MLTKSLIVAGLAGLVLAAQPATAHTAENLAAAYAADSVQTTTREVRYADLDLTTPAGHAVLEARLRRAASAVCESNAGPAPLADAMEARRCYRAALQSARQTMASIADRKLASR